MNTLLISLMITWTDVWYAIGDFFQWIFKGMRALSQMPNVFFGILIVFGIFYWCYRIMKYKKIAQSSGTIE